MKILGEARYRNGQMELSNPLNAEEGTLFYVLQVGDDLWLTTQPLDPDRTAEIEQLTIQSIQEHRKALEGLAR